MQQKIIIFSLFFLILLSGCVKKESNGVNLNKIEYKNNSTKQVIKVSQKKYRNMDYNFEIKYPEDWQLNDCKDSYFSVDGPSLMVLLSNDETINCGTRWQDRRIDITIRKKNELYLYAENESYEEKEIALDGLKIKQHLVDYEILDDEGDKTKIRPVIRRIITFIPFNDKFITLTYNELYKFLGDLTDEPQDVATQENFETTYDENLKMWQLKKILRQLMTKF